MEVVDGDGAVEGGEEGGDARVERMRGGGGVRGDEGGDGVEGGVRVLEQGGGGLGPLGWIGEKGLEAVIVREDGKGVGDGGKEGGVGDRGGAWESDASEGGGEEGLVE